MGVRNKYKCKECGLYKQKRVFYSEHSQFKGKVLTMYCQACRTKFLKRKIKSMQRQEERVRREYQFTRKWI